MDRHRVELAVVVLLAAGLVLTNSGLVSDVINGLFGGIENGLRQIGNPASSAVGGQSGTGALPNFGGPPSVGGGGQVTPGGSAGGAPGIPRAPGFITPGTTTSPPTTNLG